MKILSIILSSAILLSAIPPKTIPADLYNAFTENGLIPVYEWYRDESYPPEKPVVWTTKEINENIKKVKQGKENYYHKTDTWLYAALKQHGGHLKGKKVAIIGSLTPWYESVLLAYDIQPVTIEYNTISCDDERLEIYTVEEFAENRQTFDAVLSISSIEHSGMGRYGDKLNPYGDFEAMADIKSMLNPNGILFLAVPVCGDSITFNVHRTYGPIRLPMLLDGFEIIDSFGFSKKNFKKHPQKRFWHQPVFVLKPSST